MQNLILFCVVVMGGMVQSQEVAKPVDVTFVSYADEEDTDLALECIYPW